MDQLSFIEVSYTLLQPKEQEPRMELCPYVHKLGVKKVTNRGLMPLSRFTRSWPPIRAKKRPTHSKSCVELEPQHQVPLGQTRSIYCKKYDFDQQKLTFTFWLSPCWHVHLLMGLSIVKPQGPSVSLGTSYS